MQYDILTYAKLNLSLRVFKPRKDKFHPILSVFQAISLADKLTIAITPHQTGFVLTCTKPDVPVDETNIITRIYRRFESKLSFHLAVHLEKNIPIGAGLGGGSGNAAGFLLFLNKIAQLGLTDRDLNRIGKSFGADVPFFLGGSPAIVRGIGEKIIPISQNKYPYFIVINPRIHIATPPVFKAFDQTPASQKSPRQIPKSLFENPLGINDLRPVVMACYPEMQKIEQEIMASGVPALYMSGSGSSFFIPFTQEKESDDWLMRLQTQFPQFMIVRCNAEPAGVKFLN